MKKSYFYNYFTLATFMATHPEHKRADILHAMGTKGYANLNDWINCKHPVGITNLCKICSAFNINPLSFYLQSAGNDPQSNDIPPFSERLTPGVKYDYNTQFFRIWLDANPKVQRKDVLMAMGNSTDYASVERWYNGAPINNENLVRICTFFQIPIYCFFLQNGIPMKPCAVPVKSDNDIIAPQESKPNSKTGRGNKKESSPNSFRHTIIPKYDNANNCYIISNDDSIVVKTIPFVSPLLSKPQALKNVNSTIKTDTLGTSSYNKNTFTAKVHATDENDETITGTVHNNALSNSLSSIEKPLDINETNEQNSETLSLELKLRKEIEDLKKIMYEKDKTINRLVMLLAKQN